MLLLVHASRFHWSFVGKPLNFAIGDWQISRVYAAIGEPSLALRFAKYALKICKENNLSEILPPVYEARVRVYPVTKDSKSAKLYISKALDQLDATSLDKG
jgi:hypothetical protein